MDIELVDKINKEVKNNILLRITVNLLGLVVGAFLYYKGKDVENGRYNFGFSLGFEIIGTILFIIAGLLSTEAISIFFLQFIGGWHIYSLIDHN